MVIVVVTDQRYVDFRQLRNRAGGGPESLGPDELNRGGPCRKNRVDDEIVRTYLNYSRGMSNPRVSDVPLGDYLEVGSH